MNVMDVLRKQRRAVRRANGQPIYSMPDKRERRIHAKMKERGQAKYTTADLMRDFRTKPYREPPAVLYAKLLTGLLARMCAA